jgi:hypothetical protein
MAKSREYSLHYLNQQYSAMRWLAKQGLTPEEIREFRWWQVDELGRVVILRKNILGVRLERKISFKGSGHEWFFMKSPMYNVSWVFTAYRPKSWRRELGREALFPIEVVEKCCTQVPQKSPRKIHKLIDFGWRLC